MGTRQQGGSVDVSIVTSVLDDREALAETARGIERCDPAGLQWILVDGGSTDGSIELGASMSGIDMEHIVEPDDGIYDAWNKGLSRAAGRWILFVGAGDELDPAWLSRLRSEPDDVGFVYGDLRLRHARGEHLIRGRCWDQALERLGDGMPIPHVGTAHARWLFESGGFDPAFRILGDWEFLARCRESGGRYLSMEQATMVLGGVSNRPETLVVRKRERGLIRKRHGLKVSRRRCFQLWIKEWLGRVPGLHHRLQHWWHRLRSWR